MKEQKSLSEQMVTGLIVFVIVIALFALLYTSRSLFFPSSESPNTATTGSDNPMRTSMSSMSLTSFDVQLAKQLMDKDNDGMCDSCGMPVEMCIDSGELECTMGSSSGIGKLGTAHIHADWKAYIQGKPIDVSDKAHMDRMRNGLPVSSFIHVDSGSPPPEKTGDVLHMHATEVPLWVFFESVGMKFDKECITLETGEQHCNDEKNTLKFYVNGQLNNQYEQYVFKDLDTLLISYGPKDEDVSQQLASITDFAGKH